MATVHSDLPITPPASPPIPPLVAGDHLTRDEFERRYKAMPHLKKAELIEGVVYMPSPVRWKHHAKPNGRLVTWLGVYEASTPGTEMGDNGTVRLKLENEPQPDAAMIIDPACGGQVRLSFDDYIEGGPELAGEVAASTASIDLSKKLRLYRQNEVKEYIVWRVEDAEIDWFVLRGSQYDRLPQSPAGFYQSEIFPGLWLDPAAMTRFDMATVLQVLQRGIASPEHEAFVARLRQAAGA